MAQAKLTDPAQALKPGMFNKVENQRVRKCDEPVNRVVEDFFLIGIQNVNLGTANLRFHQAIPAVNVIK